MIKSAFEKTLPKSVEAAIVKLGKMYERYPSSEELSAEADLTIDEAGQYLKMYGKKMLKMR